MLDILALAVVVAGAFYLVWLGAMALAASKNALRFLGRFAGSAKAH